jgi:glucose dehydrogenase
VEKTYWYATGQHAVPDAGSGAVQYGYADAGWPISTAGNVLFIAATADNYCARTT